MNTAPDKKNNSVTESSLNSLFQYFNGLLPLKEKEREELRTRVKERKIRRKHYLLQHDDLCKHYTFIITGCFRMFSVDQKGTEHNLQFAAENDWITDMGSFYSGKPSQLYIEAIEPSHILQIEKGDLLFLYSHFSRVNRNFRVIIEIKFVELQNRLLQNISSTVEERYIYFLEHYPHLSHRLPSTQIASYLGVTPEFLSKVRKGMASKA